MYIQNSNPGDNPLMHRLRTEIKKPVEHNELTWAIIEIRRVHHHLWETHIKKLLTQYTVKEIIAGKIIKGVFYPSYEIGKEYYYKKPLTSLTLWQPRNHQK